MHSISSAMLGGQLLPFVVTNDKWCVHFYRQKSLKTKRNLELTTYHHTTSFAASVIP